MCCHCIQVNIERRLWQRFSDQILDQKQKRVHWDKNCLKAIAVAMDECGSVSDLFKEYLEFLKHAYLPGTTVITDLFQMFTVVCGTVRF